jgi:hypothetical protein
MQSNEFEMDKTKEELQNIKHQNDKLRDTVCSMEAKSMMNNLIIGGLPEDKDETQEITLIQVRKFLEETLKMDVEDRERLCIKRVQRIGNKITGKNRNVLTVFDNYESKVKVKSFRGNIEAKSGYYMHDQYPAEVGAQRRKLIPIMLKARKDRQDAYIKYNKLIVNGKIYTDGKYGKVE